MDIAHGARKYIKSNVMWYSKCGVGLRNWT